MAFPKHSYQPQPEKQPDFLNMAYAIFKTGGKQYKVSQGDVIDVEKLDVKPGDEKEFTEVLLREENGELLMGTPFLPNAKVLAEVQGEIKDKKIWAFKFLRRKGHHKTIGHRRRLTRLKITSV